mmetsp:Transcript_24549/g.24792  ORF Transcript_24549/g.24792 Transcript_24549/m.24792 type:complete len:241 (-) Transcript_24549:152-874(-)
MSKADGDLEFISVNRDEDDFRMNQAYTVTSDESGYDSVVGGSFFKASKHPGAALFHVLFKTLAILAYIFGGWFTSSFIFIFVVCILLLAFDFWTVKNVTGRLLVGLRWWSYVKEDGSNEWIFESLEDMAEISAFDSRIFWGALYTTPVVWILMLLVGLLRFKLEYLPIVVAAIILNGANIIGYIKCSNDAKNKMRKLVEQGFQQSSMAALENSSIRNWIFSTLLTTTMPSASGAVRSTTV